MKELRQLTAGQKAVVDAYLANYEPADVYDSNVHKLIDTHTMILEMRYMCDFDENALCDYISEKGYKAHFEITDCFSGWFLKPLYITDDD